jgi:RHH-type transcriptional regulator, rel operon repressor / antitoxin RelB
MTKRKFPMSANSQKKKSVTFRFTQSLIDKLDALAEATGRDKTFLAAEGLEQYCDLQAWQVAHIQQGIADADRGLLYSTEQVLAELGMEDGEQL